MPALRTLLLSLTLALARPPLAAGARAWEEEGAAEGAGTRGWWPMESTPEGGVKLVGATCHWWDDTLAAKVMECEVLILPKSQLAYLRIATSLDDPPRYIAVRADAGRLKGDMHHIYGIRLGFFDIDATGGPVFVRPAGDEYPSPGTGRPSKPFSREADDEVRRIVKMANTAPPDELSRPTVEVDLDKPCFRWRKPKGPAAEERAGTIQVHWNVIAHHVAVAITHRKESVSAPFGGLVTDMVENVSFHEPPGASPDMPPPSCYIDDTASSDCGLFEPHLLELKLLLRCLELPTDGYRNQKSIANFLRLVIYGLRKPIAPRQLVQLATRAILKSRWKLDLPPVMPGQVAKCFGLDRADSTVTGRVEAVACHLPMASETGFGAAYSGIMDEASYIRQKETQAAVLQAGGFRAASREEEAALGHPLLVWDKQGERKETVPLPITTIAEIDAPSICARVVADRLRRISFMKYDTYAWFGDNSEPLKSLEPTGPDAVKNCIAGANPGLLYDGGSNCRYYVGCFMRLMESFNEIPGVPKELVALCTARGRMIVERDPQWMKADNTYWMSSVGSTSYDLLTGIRSLLPGQSSPKQLAGFRVGDVVRLQKPEAESQRTLYFVASLYTSPGGPGLICLKRGTMQAGCHAPEAVKHVPTSGWTLEVGTALPVLVN